MSHTAPTTTGFHLPASFRTALLVVAAAIVAFAIGLTVSDGNDPAPASTVEGADYGIPAIIDGVPLEQRVPGEGDLAN